MSRLHDKGDDSAASIFRVLPCHLIGACILTRVARAADARAFTSTCKEAFQFGACPDYAFVQADWLLQHVRPSKRSMYIACSACYRNPVPGERLLLSLIHKIDDGLASEQKDVLFQFLLDEEEERRVPLLTRVCRFGYVNVVRALLRRGVDPNAKGELGVTALMVATRHGHDEVVKELLHAGAVVGESGQQSDTILRGVHFKAAREGLSETACVLAKPHDEETHNTLFRIAILFAQRSVVRRLLASRLIDPRVHVYHAYSCSIMLRFSTMRGHVRIAQLLLDAGTKPLVRDASKLLCTASERGHASLVSRLLDGRQKLGNCATYSDAEITDALYVAARSENDKVARLLLRTGCAHVANVVLRAIESGHDDVVRLLLRRKEVDRRALMDEATSQGHAHLMLCLLQAD